jgi:cytochrome c oxidase subunit II
VRRRTAATVLLGQLVLAGCGDDGPRWGMPEPASEEGDRVLALWQGFFVAGIAVAVLIYGLLVYVLVRYRRRNDDVPRQNPYNVPLEITYTVVPLLVVGGLFFFTQRVEPDVSQVDEDAPLVVEVTGFQWQWRFEYPDAGVSLVGTPESGPPELVLPVGETVRFELRAEDVAHSFWVPDFVEKRDLIPGLDNELDITPTRTGTFVGRCAEFCGLEHWEMGFSVRVVEPDEFADWLEEQAGA